MAGTLSRAGTAGLYALVFGVAYVGVALLEVVLGDDGLTLNTPIEGVNDIILLKATEHNIVHWVAGVVLLGAFFAGIAKPVVRAIGVVFVAVTILGLALPADTMELLGYGEGLSVPIAYTIVHALTGLGGLYAGFLASD